MKKILFLSLLVVLSSCCNSSKKVEDASKPLIQQDSNTVNFIHPTDILVRPNGVTVGYIFEINGKSYILNREGGILEINRNEEDNSFKSSGF